MMKNLRKRGAKIWGRHRYKMHTILLRWLLDLFQIKILCFACIHKVGVHTKCIQYFSACFWIFSKSRFFARILSHSYILLHETLWSYYVYLGSSERASSKVSRGYSYNFHNWRSWPDSISESRRRTRMKRRVREIDMQSSLQECLVGSYVQTLSLFQISLPCPHPSPIHYIPANPVFRMHPCPSPCQGVTSPICPTSTTVAASQRPGSTECIVHNFGGSYLWGLCANFATFSNIPCHVRIPARPCVRVSQVQFVQRPQLSLVTKCIYPCANHA